MICPNCNAPTIETQILECIECGRDCCGNCVVLVLPNQPVCDACMDDEPDDTDTLEDDDDDD